MAPSWGFVKLEKDHSTLRANRPPRAPRPRARRVRESCAAAGGAREIRARRRTRGPQFGAAGRARDLLLVPDMTPSTEVFRVGLAALLTGIAVPLLVQLFL